MMENINVRNVNKIFGILEFKVIVNNMIQIVNYLKMIIKLVKNVNKTIMLKMVNVFKNFVLSLMMIKAVHNVKIIIS